MKSFKQHINKHLYLALYKESFFIIETELLFNKNNTGKKVRCFKNFFKLNFELQKKIKVLYPAQLRIFNNVEDLFKIIGKKNPNINYLRLFYFEFFKDFFLINLFEVFKILKNFKVLLLRSAAFSVLLKLS